MCCFVHWWYVRVYSGRVETLVVFALSVSGVICCFVPWWYVRLYSGRAEVYGVATITRIKVTKNYSSEFCKILLHILSTVLQ